jgi:starvation-inducible DNA-binding protein
MLHSLFDAEYGALAEAQDDLAERIRALGLFAPGSLGAFAALTRIEEVKGATASSEMVRRLLDGHAITAKGAREVIELADAAGDVVTADLLTVRLAAHDKSAWMLRSILEG